MVSDTMSNSPAGRSRYGRIRDQCAHRRRRSRSCHAHGRPSADQSDHHGGVLRAGRSDPGARGRRRGPRCRDPICEPRVVPRALRRRGHPAVPPGPADPDRDRPVRRDGRNPANHAQTDHRRDRRSRRRRWERAGARMRHAFRHPGRDLQSARGRHRDRPRRGWHGTTPPPHRPEPGARGRARL
jgi:hypothetical protein